MFDKKKCIYYEEYFSKEHEKSFELLPGKGYVMVSAPHSVEQIRNGKIKYAEPHTGVLAKMVHDALGCPVIFKTKNCGDDANYDKISIYKQALENYIKENNIKFLIDLHQLKPSRRVKINIGTGKNKNIYNMKLLDIMVNAFNSRDVGLLQIDTPFSAAYPYTVSAYIASSCKISCLQIEINTNILQQDSKENKIEKVFDALLEIINKSSKIL